MFLLNNKILEDSKSGILKVSIDSHLFSEEENNYIVMEPVKRNKNLVIRLGYHPPDLCVS